MALHMITALGGFLGRKCDGEPGLWIGLQRVAPCVERMGFQKSVVGRSNKPRQLGCSEPVEQDQSGANDQKLIALDEATLAGAETVAVTS